MALYIPEGYSACAIKLDSASTADPWYVTFGVSISPTSSNAETVRAAFTSNIVPLMDNTITAVGMRMWDATDVTEVAFSVTGGRTMDVAPPNCACLVKKNTGKIGRKHQGRVYLPYVVGMATADLGDGGVIGTTRVTAIQTAVNDWWGDLDTGSAQMVILHNEVLAPTLVLSMTVQNVLATQRRRLR